MTFSAAGDEERGNDLEAEGVPDMFGPETADEGMIAPGDTPKAAEEWGVTAAEQQRPESLGDRVRRERPDVAVGEDEPAAGRLVEPNDAFGELDVEEPRADAPGDTGAMSAEEDAVRVEPA